MSDMPRGRDTWWKRARRRGNLALGLSLTLLTVLALFNACSDDNSPAGPIDCSFRNVARYSYDSTVIYDLPQRAANVPPESPDRGASAFNLTQDFRGGSQAPDRVQATVTTGGSYGSGGAALEVIEIGNNTWNRVDPGAFAKANGTKPELYTTGRVCAALAPDLNFTSVTPSSEVVGEVQTQHYSFPNQQTKFAANLFGAASDFAIRIPVWTVDVWLNDNQHPMKLTIAGTGKYENGRDLRVSVASEVSKLNDDSVNIVEPR